MDVDVAVTIVIVTTLVIIAVTLAHVDIYFIYIPYPNIGIVEAAQPSTVQPWSARATLFELAISTRTSNRVGFTSFTPIVGIEFVIVGKRVDLVFVGIGISSSTSLFPVFFLFQIFSFGVSSSCVGIIGIGVIALSVQTSGGDEDHPQKEH